MLGPDSSLVLALKVWGPRKALYPGKALHWTRVKPWAMRGHALALVPTSCHHKPERIIMEFMWPGTQGCVPPHTLTHHDKGLQPSPGDVQDLLVVGAPRRKHYFAVGTF